MSADVWDDGLGAFLGDGDQMLLDVGWPPVDGRGSVRERWAVTPAGELVRRGAQR